MMAQKKNSLQTGLGINFTSVEGKGDTPSSGPSMFIGYERFLNDLFSVGGRLSFNANHYGEFNDYEDQGIEIQLISHPFHGKMSFLSFGLSAEVSFSKFIYYNTKGDIPFYLGDEPVDAEFRVYNRDTFLNFDVSPIVNATLYDNDSLFFDIFVEPKFYFSFTERKISLGFVNTGLFFGVRF